jgi:hypothetical protein
MKHRPSGRRRNKILVDTNILLLYIVGSLSLDRIARHKRTNTFTVEDYHLLDKMLRQSRQIVVTPNILTEVSNLLGQTDENTKEELWNVLSALMPDLEERYIKSRDAVGLPEFSHLGLTDASILSCPVQDLTVLTDDLRLYLALNRRGAEVINFNHLRGAALE